MRPACRRRHGCTQYQLLGLKDNLVKKATASYYLRSSSMSTSFCWPVAGSYRVGTFVNDVSYDIFADGKLTRDVEFHFLNESKHSQISTSLLQTRLKCRRAPFCLVISSLVCSRQRRGYCGLRRGAVGIRARKGMDVLFGTNELNLIQLSNVCRRLPPQPH